MPVQKRREPIAPGILRLNLLYDSTPQIFSKTYLDFLALSFLRKGIGLPSSSANIVKYSSTHSFSTPSGIERSISFFLCCLVNDSFNISLFLYLLKLFRGVDLRKTCGQPLRKACGFGAFCEHNSGVLPPELGKSLLA